MSGERIEPAPTEVAARGFFRDLTVASIASGLVAFLFAASGPVVVILATGTKGGLSEADLASWLFGAFFINGLISIAFCFAYRQPLAFFWTIPGTVLVGPALGHLTLGEVIAAFIATGVLMLVLGATGWVRRAMQAFPMPIVMGMVAGVFLQFGLDWVRAFQSDPVIAMAMTAAFLLAGAAPAAVSGRLPPLIVALIAGAGVIAANGTFAPGLDQVPLLAEPRLHLPELSWTALVELVVLVQNGQGIAVLTAAGHTPPINAIAVACGAGSIVCAFVGCVSTCLTGPVNAIISSGSRKHSQYTAGIIVGALALGFGALSPLFTRLLLAAPPAFIATLAGLAMLRVLQSAFAIGFQGRCALGALVTFLVTVAGIPILNIGAPFWALIAGAAVSLVMERDDWRER
ncbi:MAG: benzoate transporter, partial [Alphaproteobacteria bacterium]